jgi:NAD(P)H-hydrate epimerase
MNKNLEMIRPISIQQAQAFDKQAQEKLGIPSIILMENAGRSVAEEAMKMRLATGDRRQATIAIVCGTGNNGGDGLVAARHLINAGMRVNVYLVGPKSKLKNDPRINLNILLKMGRKIKWVKSVKDLSGITKSKLIIDALFGIGLNSPVKGFYLEVINAMNKSNVPILSIDVPSGLNADTGKALGAAVQAKKIVTFVAPKKGLPKATVRDIGIVLDY